MSMVFLGFLWDFKRISMGFPFDFCGIFWGFPGFFWYYYGIYI
jgi:hypothetical protein